MQLKHLSIDGRRKLPFYGFHALLGRWLRWALLAMLALGWQAAMATPIYVEPGSEIVVDVPNPQPGIPVDEFEMKFSFIRLEKGLHGKIKFKVVGANHRDLTGIEVPAELPLDSPGPTAEAKFRPKFLKAGWYHILADFESNEFNGGIQFSILLYNGKVYYSWIGTDLLHSMARFSLRNHDEYQSLVSKVNKKHEQWKKSHPGEEEPLPFERWLSKEELKRISEIVRGEEGRIYRSIQQESKPHPEKSEDSDKKISKGETVTIKVRFAIDHDFSKFLPLHGAVIRVTHAGKVPPGLAELIAYGRLDEKGELKFISPVDDLKYQVQLLGKHDRFNIGILKDADNFTSLISLFDQKEEINIKPDDAHKDNKFHISKAEANSWSVFQALYELTEHVKPIAGIPEAPVFKKVVTNRPSPREAFHRAGSDGGKKRCLKCTWVLSSLLTGT